MDDFLYVASVLFVIAMMLMSAYWMAVLVVGY